MPTQSHAREQDRTPDELGLVVAGELEGLASTLVAIARARTGACDAALWVLDPDATTLARVGGDGARFERRAVGFEQLPAEGPASSAPPPWSARHAWAALPLVVGEALLGVLALAFDDASTRPAGWESSLRSALALAAGWLDRRRLRAELAHAQAEGLLRAGAGLAHVLGNVLQAVQSSIDHARAGPSADARAALDEASSALRRASAVVRQLASLGGTRGDPQPTEMGALVTGLVAAIESEMPEGLTLRLERGTRAELWCEVDAVAVESALAGIMHRAREAVGAEGQIAVALRMVAHAAGRSVEIEVRSAPHRVESGDRVTTPVLEPRREVPGNDGGDTQGAVELGLRMARAAIARYGGTVDDRAGDEHVTLVRLPLGAPREPPRLSRTSSVEVLQAPVARRLRVLVADDEPAVLRGVQRLLEHAGHEVRAASDGVEAVALARAFAPLDVALMDLTMPRLGGPPLAAALKRVAPGAAIVVMTGYASTAMTEALRHEGVVAVLTKPVAGATLLAAVVQAAEGAAVVGR